MKPILMLSIYTFLVQKLCKDTPPTELQMRPCPVSEICTLVQKEMLEPDNQTRTGSI